MAFEFRSRRPSKTRRTLRKEHLLLLVLMVIDASIVSMHSNIAAASTAKVGQLSAGLTVGPCNSYLAIQVAPDGSFNQGAHPDPSSCGVGSGSFNLSYKWPGSPGTSFDTLRIDGQDLVYGSTGTQLSPPTDTTPTTNQSSWQVTPTVKATQTLSIVTGPSTGNPDTALISYDITNTDTASHQIGMRDMIDTMLNGNDGAPFFIPGAGGVTTEMEFNGASVPQYWQAFYSLTSSSQYSSQGTLVGGGATPPDRFVVASWPQIDRTLFDYTVTPGEAVTGDSAVGVYWMPRTLTPGATLHLATLYGLSGFTQDLTPPLALLVTAPASLSATNSGTYTPNPFTVSAFTQNVGVATATATTLSLGLPSGLTLAPGQSPTFSIGDLGPGATAQTSWQVLASPQTSASVLNYSVTAAATNAPSKVLSRAIAIPATLGGMNCGPQGGTPPGYLGVRAIEIVQTIQDWCGTVPLVANKSTIARLHFQAPTGVTGPAAPVSGVLIAIQNGQELPYSPLQPDNAGRAIVPSSNPEAVRGDLNSTLNFTLPASWTAAGSISLDFSIFTRPREPIACPVDATFSNPSFCSVTATFNPATNPRFVIVPVSVTYNGVSYTPDGWEVQEVVSRLLLLYPTARVDALSRPYVEQCRIDPNGCDLGFLGRNHIARKDWSANLLNDLGQQRRDDGVDDRIYLGLVKDFQGAFAALGSGAAYESSDVSWTLAADSGGEFANDWLPYRNEAAHEIGHDLGLTHPQGPGSGSLCLNEPADPIPQPSSPFTVHVSAADYTPPSGLASFFPYSSVFPYQLAYALGPMNSGPDAEIWGLDTREYQRGDGLRAVISPLNTFDYMSYCLGLRSFSAGGDWQWTTASNYEYLLDCQIPLRFNSVPGALGCNSFTPHSATSLPAAQAPAARGSGQTLLVEGLLDTSTDLVSFDPVYRSHVMQASSTGTGPYSIEVRDAQGTVLSQTHFSPKPADISFSAGGVGSDAAFSAVLADSPQAREITVSHSAAVIGAVAADAIAPKVTVTASSPSPGPGSVTVRWASVDADSADLSAWIEFSADGGQNWQTLSTHATGHSLTIDSRRLRGTTDALFRVSVSDGFWSGTDTTARPLTIPASPPTVSIDSPVSGRTYRMGEMIVASGSAMDPQDGELSGTALSWRIDGKDVGSGSTLNYPITHLDYGRHRLVLVGVDTAGQTATANITINVANPCDMDSMGQYGVFVGVSSCAFPG
jgi:hypothetical protein